MIQNFTLITFIVSKTTLNLKIEEVTRAQKIIKVSSFPHKVQSRQKLILFLSFLKPDVGQNIAFHASPVAMNSTFLVHASPVAMNSTFLTSAIAAAYSTSQCSPKTSEDMK